MIDKKEKSKYDKKYYIEHREKILQFQKQYRTEHPEKILGKAKQYYKDNKEKMGIKHEQYYENNKEKIKKQNKQWCQENKKHKNEYDNLYKKNKYKTNLKFNLNCKISKAIRYSLKGNKKSKHWIDLIGYSLKDLIKRLKKTIPKGYTWQDYLENKLEIDHKIPISAFNFTKPTHQDFLNCWALSNLRLLPKKENRNKSNRLEKPFQPALMI